MGGRLMRVCERETGDDSYGMPYATLPCVDGLCLYLIVIRDVRLH